MSFTPVKSYPRVQALLNSAAPVNLTSLDAQLRLVENSFLPTKKWLFFPHKTNRLHNRNLLRNTLNVIVHQLVHGDDYQVGTLPDETLLNTVFDATCKDLQADSNFAFRWEPRQYEALRNELTRFKNTADATKLSVRTHLTIRATLAWYQLGE